MIAYLWAQNNDGVIGYQGKLPWRLPNDLKFFKDKTVGNAVVMGRKTFEGMNKKVLPDRINIVLTTDPNYEADETVLIMHNREEILKFAQTYEKDTFITGGTGVFEDFMDDVDVLYRTMIEGEFDGDAYMPAIDWSKWELAESKEGVVDDRNKYPHVFEVYKRKKYHHSN